MDGSTSKPDVARPRHVAIIMDGNGRWATQRHLPRVAGHKRGVEAVRSVIKAAGASGIEYLTLFAFSSENWRRPADEVSLLMRLFVSALQKEVGRLHEAGIRLRVVGELGAFQSDLQALIASSEDRTAGNAKLTVTICANYGGRWDMVQATRRLLAAEPECAADPAQITEERLAPYFALAYAPDADLVIRTGGEQRISNFLLWQAAYSELYFTDVLWPDFDAPQLDTALAWYAERERRFGMTSEQLRAAAPADVA